MANRYHGISRMAAQSTELAATNSNAMTLLNSTDSIVDAILADINQAQQSCLLAFYGIEPQGKIETLLDAVIAASSAVWTRFGRCGGQQKLFRQRLGGS